jgi:hypothetical protein
MQCCGVVFLLHRPNATPVYVTMCIHVYNMQHACVLCDNLPGTTATLVGHGLFRVQCLFVYLVSVVYDVYVLAGSQQLVCVGVVHFLDPMQPASPPPQSHLFLY